MPYTYMSVCERCEEMDLSKIWIDRNAFDRHIVHIIDILSKSMLEKNSMPCYSICVCLALRIFSFFYFLQPKQYRENRRVEKKHSAPNGKFSSRSIEKFDFSFQRWRRASYMYVCCTTHV